jgi:hypothetical protein
MTDTIEQVAAILKDAAETHHTVYRIVNGVDPAWASWYADWLIALSTLPDILGTRPGARHGTRASVMHRSRLP